MVQPIKQIQTHGFGKFYYQYNYTTQLVPYQGTTLQKYQLVSGFQGNSCTSLHKYQMQVHIKKIKYNVS